MIPCETTRVDGTTCPGLAWPGRRQCEACLNAQTPPADELVLSVVATSFDEAALKLRCKRLAFERDFPHVRLLTAGTDADYDWSKSRQHVSERQHWWRFAVRRR